MERFKIATFYRFADLDDLDGSALRLTSLMDALNVFGTIIISEEGYNATVSAAPERLKRFLRDLPAILGPLPKIKYSAHQTSGFKRRKVKIKDEIVTLRKRVNMGLAVGTQVRPEKWDQLLNDPGTLILDARNDYEFKVGSFRGAINPRVEKFSSLPEFIETHLDPDENHSIATFCTGGIRCEKLAPFLLEKGFRNVYQLDGGILNYLEKTGNVSGLWDGECFVFDERVTVDDELRKGSAPDLSAPKKESSG